jgi:hypothetical protein
MINETETAQAGLNIDVLKVNIESGLQRTIEELKHLNSSPFKTRSSAIAQTEAETALLWFRN